MTSLKKDKADHMKRNFLDRSRQTFRMKSFTTDQLHNITKTCWTKSGAVHNSLRDDMSEFNTRAMSLRGEHMRKLELSDIFIDEISNQGVGECKAVISVLNQGKTNQFGKAEFAATMRHRDVLQCPQNKMAFYLLHRFDMTDEGLPNFENQENWFNVKMYRGKNGCDKTAQVSYNSHLRAVHNLYEACGFKVQKKKLILCVEIAYDTHRLKV